MSLTDLPTPTALVPQQKFRNPLLNFSRNSKKWAWDARGRLTEYAADEPAFDHDPVTGVYRGYLIEESRTNEIKDSRDMTTGEWGGSASASRDAIGIDGEASTACTITDNGATAQRVEQDITITSSTNSHTTSLYIKKDDDTTRFPAYWLRLVGGTEVGLRVTINTSNGNTEVETDNGTNSHYVRDYGEWWRLVISSTDNDTGNSVAFIYYYPAFGDTEGGSNGSTTGSSVIDQAQVELNTSYPSSPIITGDQTVTRSADNPFFDNLRWYNQEEGTVLVNVTDADFTGVYAWVFNDGTNDSFYGIRLRDDNNFFLAGRESVDGGYYEVSIGAKTGNDKIAVTYDKDTGAFRYCLNGGSVSSDSNISTDLPITEARIGGLTNANGFISVGSALSYPRALTDAQLKALTR